MPRLRGDLRAHQSQSVCPTAPPSPNIALADATGAPGCASAVCRQCTSIVGNFPAALNSCCKQARPTDCFIGLANGGGAAATTATGPLTDAAAPTTGGGATMTMTTPPPTTGPDSMTMSPDSMTASPASMTTSPASIASSGSTATPGPSTTSSRAGAAGRDLRAEMAVAGMAGLGLLAWAL